METLPKESSIILAIQAIEKREKLSPKRVAKVYRAPETTLPDRMNHTSSRSDCRNGRLNLTKSKEDTIVQHVLSLDERGFPPRVAGLETMANFLLEKRNGEHVGHLWAHRFIARQEEFKTHSNRIYDFQRASCEDPELILSIRLRNQTPPSSPLPTAELGHQNTTQPKRSYFKIQFCEITNLYSSRKLSNRDSFRYQPAGERGGYIGSNHG